MPLGFPTFRACLQKPSWAVTHSALEERRDPECGGDTLSLPCFLRPGSALLMLMLFEAGDVYANGLKSPKPEEEREVASWLDGPGQPPKMRGGPETGQAALSQQDWVPCLEVGWFWPDRPGLASVRVCTGGTETAPLGRLTPSSLPLRYRARCAQSGKGTSQFALERLLGGCQPPLWVSRPLQAPPHPNARLPAPHGRPARGPPGRAVSERGRCRSGRGPRCLSTAWPVRWPPRGVLGKKACQSRAVVRRQPKKKSHTATSSVFRGF